LLLWSGLTVGLGALKDVALVVVGFYFGTQKRVVELETKACKMREVIEHSNPVPRESDQKSKPESEKDITPPTPTPEPQSGT